MKVGHSPGIPCCWKLDFESNPVSDTQLLQLCKLILSLANLQGGLLWTGKGVAVLWGCYFYLTAHCGRLWKMVLSRKTKISLRFLSKSCQLSDGTWMFLHEQCFVFVSVFNRLMLYSLDNLFRSLKWNPVFRNWNLMKNSNGWGFIHSFPLEKNKWLVSDHYGIYHGEQFCISHEPKKQVPGIKETDSLCVTTRKVSLNAVHSQTSVRIFFFYLILCNADVEVRDEFGVNYISKLWK